MICFRRIQSIFRKKIEMNSSVDKISFKNLNKNKNSKNNELPIKL